MTWGVTLSRNDPPSRLPPRAQALGDRPPGHSSVSAALPWMRACGHLSGRQAHTSVRPLSDQERPLDGPPPAPCPRRGSRP